MIQDAKTLKPIPGALVNFCNKKSSTTGSDGEASLLFKKNSVCDITASALGYRDKSKTIKIGLPGKGIVLKDTLLLDMIVNEQIRLKNIYYDFDRWDILPESAIELDRLVSFTKENPLIKVELSSHTDSRGPKLYNLKLSQLRAKAAVDYVVSKGIDKSMVSGVGYGETQLINKCSDGVKCTPAQHRENRRTELYIPGILSGEPVKQEIGDYSNGKPDHTRGYSSTKEHGSIFVKAANVNQGRANTLHFNLILGSFNDTINATKFVQQLKADGYTAIILNDSEHVRVGNRYNYYSQARKALEDLKAISQIGWIMQGK